MPLHRIFHTPGAFSDDEQQQLSNAITKLYTNAGLPAFYVVVLFIPLKPSGFLIGGKQNNNHFVRISVEHLARSFEIAEQAKGFLNRYEDTIAPFIKAKGYDWETQITECDRNLWRVNGLEPPLARTAAEKEWVRQNRAVPFDPKDNV